MIHIKNRAQFQTQVNAWVNSVRRGTERAVYRMMVDAQTFATLASPTFSGDYASNWNVSFGKPDVTFVAGGIDFYADNYPGPVSRAWGKGNVAPASSFKLGQTAYLTNAAEHDEPYAWLIEEGKINFRPENVGRDRIAQKTLDHLAHNYKSIKRTMMV